MFQRTWSGPNKVPWHVAGHALRGAVRSKLSRARAKGQVNSYFAESGQGSCSSCSLEDTTLLNGRDQRPITRIHFSHPERSEYMRGGEGSPFLTPRHKIGWGGPTGSESTETPAGYSVTYCCRQASPPPPPLLLLQLSHAEQLLGQIGEGIQADITKRGSNSYFWSLRN